MKGFHKDYWVDSFESFTSEDILFWFVFIIGLFTIAACIIFAMVGIEALGRKIL